ncbi:hypothetical protein [Pontibacter flavimaris]|uniref:Uncharacterized protein n=1 Tax=Pontibacter flavimaris TaxID=1797110 RepID=A0A1Q5PFT1_9BACT|nr:hypothetical protein [Pontibacter flavimaris]OKL41110.1 hypothetical protein A3841_14900 [Pontibacter flavimaris]
METNKNNTSASQTQGQSNRSNMSPSGSTQSNSNQHQGNLSNQHSSNQNQNSSSQNMQGRSNQKATTGQGGMKDIQGKLTQFGSTAANKFNSMTTTQKAMVGGAVLALGAGWMAMSQKNKNKIKNQISSAAGSAKDALHNINAKQQQNRPGSSSGNVSGSSYSSGTSGTNARVK